MRFRLNGFAARPSRAGRIHGMCLAALCAAAAGPGGAPAATAEGPVLYTFRSAAYEQIVDPSATPHVSYTAAMALRLDVTLAGPLAAGLQAVPLVPLAVGFDDGIHAERRAALSRFVGWASTDAAGTVTDFFVQLLLAAPGSPGLWLRRDAVGTAYRATRAQSVVTGHTDPCGGWTDCAPNPVVAWITDSAAGSGPISVFADPLLPSARAPLPAAASFAPEPAPSPVPGPAPLALLVAALLCLGAMRLRRL